MKSEKIDWENLKKIIQLIVKYKGYVKNKTTRVMSVFELTWHINNQWDSEPFLTNINKNKLYGTSFKALRSFDRHLLIQRVLKVAKKNNWIMIVRDYGLVSHIEVKLW